MDFTQVYPDVGVVASWYGSTTEVLQARYTALKPPKTQLLLASLTQYEKDIEFQVRCGLRYSKPILKAEGWKPIGWYPSCHDHMTGYKVWLYAKVQKDAPLSTAKCALSFSQLHCSVVRADDFILRPTSWYTKAHGVLGLRRIPLAESPKEDEVKRWRKFATTDLATYWFWGLEPREKDVYKLEPDLKPKEG